LYHVLVACRSMMARCTVESMIRSYHEYISKLSLESELDLLKYCDIDFLTSILTQNKLKHTSRCCAPHVTKMGNWQKKLANCCDLPNSSKFFPLQSFLLYGKHNMTTHEILRSPMCVSIDCNILDPSLSHLIEVISYLSDHNIV